MHTCLSRVLEPIYEPMQVHIGMFVMLFTLVKEGEKDVKALNQIGE